MTQSGAPHIQALHTDHENFARALQLIESTMARFHEGRNVDYEMLRDLIVYMSQYPDLFHHPREDLVFGKLLVYDASLENEVNALLAEHEELTQVNNALLEDLERALAGELVERDAIEKDARDYVEKQRQHMSREEQQLLPLAVLMLTDVDWQDIDARIAQRPDPLFGDIVEARYRDLLEYL